MTQLAPEIQADIADITNAGLVPTELELRTVEDLAHPMAQVRRYQKVIDGELDLVGISPR